MRILRAALLGVLVTCSFFVTVAAQQAITIEKLLSDGWEVTGYIAAFENRTLILFKHKDQKYLVQCSVLTDVLRSPRLVISCYELR
jgi:hypothetical protein